MSTQELDVRKAWRAVVRNRRVVAVVAAVGLVGGIGTGLLVPSMHSASSLVVLPPPPASETQPAPAAGNIDTQVFIANSEPVLKSAGQNLRPPLEVKELRKRVEVKAVTPDVIQIKARGTSEVQATGLANAVAEVYLIFVTTEQKLPGDLGKKTGARILERATTTTGGGLLPHLALYGGLGLLAGALLGAIAALIIARSDRRLRLREEIADAIGVPVVASVASYRAKGVSDWANLLERYNPSAVDAWSLRKTLHRLGLDGKEATAALSLAVVTFADDEPALPIGPQLAAFATSIGIRTSLLLDNHQDGVKALPADLPAPGPNTGLDILLIVVDREEPQLRGALRTTATVVALSAGAVTAEELARLAVAAAADDRSFDGILVADPDPTDRTAGRVPQSARRASAGLPTLLTGTARRKTR